MNATTEPQGQSDEELAAQAAAGSRTAFEELVSRYSPRLFYFLRSRTESDEDIEDLVQETFWLFTLAVRLAISRHRSKKTRPESPLDPEVAEHPSPGPQERLIRKEEAQEQKNIWNLARTLRPGEYRALWLRYAEGLPVKDIARAMNKTQLGVRALLHRSRLKLGEKLKTASPSAVPAEAVSVRRRLEIL
jgi:DNA-directed RNA polymerase specialized sigma24 family protein